MARNHFVLLALAAVGPALISSGCNSGANTLSGTGGTPGSGGDGQLGREHGNGRRGTVLPQRDRLRRQRGRHLDGHVVVPEGERQPRSVAGRRGLPVGAGHRGPPGQRNLDRQRRRDVHRRHDHDGHRTVHARARPAWSSRRPPSAAPERRASSRTWASTRSPARRRRAAGATARATVHQSGGLGLLSRRAVDERQLHDRAATSSRITRRWRRHEVLVLRLGEHADRDPPEHSPTMTGTIVLQKSGGTGLGSGATAARAARRARAARPGTGGVSVRGRGGGRAARRATGTGGGWRGRRGWHGRRERPDR